MEQSVLKFVLEALWTIHKDNREIRFWTSFIVVAIPVFITLIIVTGNPISDVYIVCGASALLIGGAFLAFYIYAWVHLKLVRAWQQIQSPQSSVPVQDESDDLLALPRHRRNTATNGGYVYVIRGSENRTKIGIATHLERRVRDLQRASSDHLKVVASVRLDNPRQVEKLLHRRYRHKRLHGEWFDLSDDEVEEIKKMLASQ